MGDYVEPYVKGVDPIDPPKVEHAGPFVDSVDSEVPVVEPVTPVQLDPVETASVNKAEEPERKSVPEQKSDQKGSKKR